MAVRHNLLSSVLLFLSLFYFASSKKKKCEQIKIPMCQNIGYNLTSTPNMFNHDTQEEAALEINQFWPLVEIKCSPDLTFFLCSMYAPICQPHINTSVPPCRSICKKARKGCTAFLKKYGLSWPQQMRCKNFPKGVGDGLCLGGARDVAANHAFTSRPTELTETKTTSKKRCEQIKIPMCLNIGYNSTSMPNMFNHDTQAEAALELQQFWPLVEIKCSPDLRLFLCSVYAPMCRSNFEEDVPPCRSVCERARKGCAFPMRQYGFSWPERIKCENFPKVSDKLCLKGYGVTANHTTKARPKELPGTKKTSKKKCEKIKIPLCQNIGYNLTYMPNMFNHDTQEEAALEVHQFWPLIEIKCSPDLRLFLCSMYGPICQPNFKDEVPPCRSICIRARTGCAPLMRQFGFSWPERMKCENFPKLGDRLCLHGSRDRVNHITTAPPTELTTTKTASKSNCEKIKIPMCQNIGYNLTSMPNIFNHSTQNEAALEIHHFWPLVNQKCSPDIKYFLCSLYAPMCQPNIARRVPPCRSLCKSARKGCLALLRPFGFSWSEKMRCRNFPKRGSGQICIQ